MAQTINKPIAQGATEVEETYKKKRGWFLFFPTESWIKVNTESFGDDIMIKTDRPIRDVYINGKLISLKK